MQDGRQAYLLQSLLEKRDGCLQSAVVLGHRRQERAHRGPVSPHKQDRIWYGYLRHVTAGTAEHLQVERVDQSAE